MSHSPQQLVDSLAAALALDKQPGLEQLATLRPELVELGAVLRGFQVRSQLTRDRTDVLLLQATDAVADMLAQHDQLQIAVDAAGAELAQDVSLSSSLQSQAGQKIGQYNADIAIMQRVEDHRRKLKKYWWVPGYGQYLAVQELVDVFGDALADSKIAAREIDGLRNEINNTTTEIGDLQAKITALTAKVTAFNTSIQGLTAQTTVCETEVTRLAGQVVASSQALDFHARLVTATENLDVPWDDLSAMLDEEVRYNDGSGSQKIPLRQAMVIFAKEEAKAAVGSAPTDQTVSRVEFRGDSNELLALTQTGEIEWTLTNDSTQKELASYGEKNRDDGVQLYNDYEEFGIAWIDLTKGTVGFKKKGVPGRRGAPGANGRPGGADLPAVPAIVKETAIEHASSAVSGWTVNEIATTTTGVTFAAANNGKWGELHYGHPVTTYTETSRDCWSVYVSGPDPKTKKPVKLALDLWRKVVTFDDGTPASDLYAIDTAAFDRSDTPSFS